METAKLLPPAVVVVLSACRLSLSRRFALGVHVENGRRCANSIGGGSGSGGKPPKFSIGLVVA